MNSLTTIAKPRVPRKRTGFYFPKPDGTERRLKSKPHAKIVDAPEGIYSVRSDTNHDQWYIVDAISGLCSCEAGHTAHGCWHRWYMSYLFMPVLDFVRVDDEPTEVETREMADAPLLSEPIDMQTWQPSAPAVPTQWGRFKPAHPEFAALYESTPGRARRSLA